MLDEEKYPFVDCSEPACGARQQASYCEPYRSNMINLKLCFTCLHWTELAKEKETPNHLVVQHENGQRGHYQIGDETASRSRWRGFGGSKFIVRFLSDGRIVESTNMWHQGTIPEYFYERLPVNAEFLREAKGNTYSG